MSLKAKNKYIFSYNNKEINGSKYINKDFEKTNSYCSKFIGAQFINTTLRAAKFKYCTFIDCKFINCLIIGTNFKGSKFEKVFFEKCIISSCPMNKTNISDTVVKDCYIIGQKNIKGITNNNSTIIDNYPTSDFISNELYSVIESLRSNDIIRRSQILHCKKKKLNTISIKILLEKFTEEELIKYLKELPNSLTTQFYTVSYIEKMLTKIKENDKI